MSPTVVFSRKADAQLRSLRRYIAHEATQAIANNYVAAIAARCRAIANLPQGGTPREDLGQEYRSVSYKRRVTIIYRLRHDTIVIAGVFYGGQDIARHFPSEPT